MSPRTSKPISAANQAIASQNQLTFPFLRLPSEIRNQIYSYALGGHEIYLITLPGNDKKKRLGCRPPHQKTWEMHLIPERLAINLPLTCRQIRCDLGAYYPFIHNTFGATVLAGFHSMLHRFTIGQRNRIELVVTDHEHYPTGRWLWIQEYIMLCGLPRLKLVGLRDVSGVGEREREEIRRTFLRELGDGVRVEIVDDKLE